MIKKNLKKHTPFIASTIAALILLAAVSTSTTEAGPRPHGAPFFGGAYLFFLDGIFHKKDPNGYFVTQAPIGALVPDLPPAAVIVNIEGRPYYTYSGVYYQQVSEGYIVVKQPNAPMIQGFKERQQTQVIVEYLNVRSGPGKGTQVIRQVRQGEVLVVEDVKADWCLVRLSDGSHGWVMSQYTSAIAAEPKG